MTFYIVMQPQSGYPAPTGYLTIMLGFLTYDSIPVGANGATLVQLAPWPGASADPVSQITVDYGGDTRYPNSSFNFPLTNQGIPGSAPVNGPTTGGGGHGGASTASATPTAKSATPTATATAKVAASPTASPSAHPRSVSSPANAFLPWLAGGVGALALLGALASGIIIAQRRKLAQAAASQEPITEVDMTQAANGPDPDSDPDQ